MAKNMILRVFSLLLPVMLLVSLGACKPQAGEATLPTTVVTEAPDTRPTLVVRGAEAKAGDKTVEVTVEVRNNPGIFGIDFDLYFDESALKLVNAESMLELEECYFTTPAYYRNPTSFLWDFQNANFFEDGVMLKLHFEVLDTAKAGEYEVKIMYSYGNIFDADGAPIDMKTKNAYVTVIE